MKRKKRAMTLLEVMIVIFIIGIISSVIGYNMKGSLEKAKAFKTAEGIKKVKEIIDLEIAQGMGSVPDTIEKAKDLLANSGLVSNPDDLLKDGWGVPYTIKISRVNGSLILKSENYDKYQTKHKKAAPKEEDEEESE